MMPTTKGGMLSLDYAYQDQNKNWSGTSPAPAADNDDKDIRTSFYTLVYQQVFNRAWSLRAELPYAVRHFETTGGPTGDDIVDLNYRGIGDARLEGIYTTQDRSFGVTFGAKLPTGSYTLNDTYGDIDRDTEIGSGSTDILLGAFKRFALTNDLRWNEFAQVLFDSPVLTRDQYRPGSEADAAAGVYYDGWFLGGLRVSPIGEVKVSMRGRDTGANASSPAASGYTRLILAPGLEVDGHRFRISAELGVTVFQRITGDQLTAPLSVSVATAWIF
jgi:hypothetical protein